MGLPKRKPNRFKNYDYSRNGYYFITICAKDRKCLFGEIVGDVAHGVPEVKLSTIGEVVGKYVERTNFIYENIKIDTYIIMPNHLHFIIAISNNDIITNVNNGTPRASSHTGIPQIITALKKMTNSECGIYIWQRSYHDHIIRNEQEYNKIYKYIENNPLKWEMDCYNKNNNERDAEGVVPYEHTKN